MAASNAPIADARRGARRRTLLRGRICWGPHHAISADCTIRDLSETGAQLRLPATQALPPTFALVHVSEGTAYEAALAWRRDDLAGVKFMTKHDLKASVPRELMPLRQTWLALAPS
ncbi:PilZ domain-containing protein [Phenylobacterium sp.]|jgi:hypothetical protein|uniref:PilZ domain-containing protein n=1 Tax=Phenylobacterium sp. TaxID=1871053 RepID=UPI002E307F23|nr:PilZ domain-containing protein [Phenylobacterium sp.]HEX2560199.1 PilZ domain-containing protein [Phenylobacterium sp.]